MKFCAKCNKQTNSNYLVGLSLILCSSCAKEHGYNEMEKLNKEISELKASINNIRNDVNEAIYSDCKHEFKDNGYGKFIDGDIKIIYCCSICGLEKLGDKEAIL